MNRAITVSAFLLFSACILFGQAKPQAAMADQEMITSLENAWNEAMQKYDVKWYESHLADNFISTDENGEVKGKPAMSADLKNRVAKVQSIGLENFKVRLFGDTAIATGILVYKGTYKGKDISGKYPYTDTWVRLGGQWQCVASHESKLASK